MIPIVFNSFKCCEIVACAKPSSSTRSLQAAVETLQSGRSNLKQTEKTKLNLAALDGMKNHTTNGATTMPKTEYLSTRKYGHHHRASVRKKAHLLISSWQ